MSRSSRTPVVPLVVVSVLAAVLASCGGEPRDRSTPRRASEARVAATSAVRVVAVGDIACAPGVPVTPTTCQHAATAQVARSLAPDAALVLGDLQYQTGSLEAFHGSYDKSWGQLRPITHPVPGNHEYDTARAAGYYSYFSRRQPGPPGWYVRNLGRWRAYFLNSNCDEVDCARQATWFARDLDANPRRCSLVVSHHPRWSSGQHGNDPTMARFYRIAFNHHVEVMLSGHDHHYERFHPKRSDGSRGPRGVVQFVVGTGGKSNYPANDVVAGSAYRLSRGFGVLRMTLGQGAYSWAWKGIGGGTRDSGRRDCT